MTETNTQTHIIIHTDGACSGNPGPGGWGAVIQGRNGKTKELKGGDADTTNNRMELMAAIKALEWLEAPRPILVYTDSQYVTKGITEWIINWKRNGWVSSDNKFVKNQDLWERLDALAQHHDVIWEWVKGHAGNAGNERADALARAGMTKYVKG